MLSSIAELIRGIYGTLQELRVLKNGDANDQALYDELRALITSLIHDYRNGVFNAETQSQP